MKTTEELTPVSSASETSRFREGPPPTSSSAASGTERRTAGSERMRVSCPFRGISRETQTTTGRSARPSEARTSSPSPGRNTSVSTPGDSCRSFVAFADPSATASRDRV